MIREEQFTQSHQPYAVDLASFEVTERDPEHGSCWARVGAVWFRRRRSGSNGPMLTVACAGELRELLRDPEPADAAEFLARYTDGCYGGRCAARWDGHNLWAPEMGEDDRAAYKRLLVPMLAAWPACPDGWSGWWTFRG